MIQLRGIEYSIEELENDFWPDLKNYPSPLVERCYKFRKIKLSNLQINQIITLLIQDIGSEHLLPLVIERMEGNLLEEDSYNGSSFIQSFSSFNLSVLNKNINLKNKITIFFSKNQNNIESIIGWKEYERIIKNINVKTT